MPATAVKPVLIVQDQLEARQDIADALVRADLCVVESDGCDEALQRIREVVPAVIILDWRTADFDSERLLCSLASDPAVEAVPVVVLASINEMRLIPVEWVAAVMAKPARLPTIVEVVRKLTQMTPRPQSAVEHTVRTATPRFEELSRRSRSGRREGGAKGELTTPIRGGRTLPGPIAEKR